MKSCIKKLWDEVNNFDDDVNLSKNIRKRLDTVFALYLEELNTASENIELKMKRSKSSNLYKEFK